jgi:putative effector of murein hydrolase LrgA (UPF0299 family)
MNWIREVTRRLGIFYIILMGCLALGGALENYLMIEEKIPKYITGPLNMFLFLFLLIWSVGQLKFEPLR